MVYHQAPFFLYTLFPGTFANVRAQLAGTLQHSNPLTHG
jgi:hypothetical protein